MKVRLFKPSVGAEELAEIQSVFDIAWLGNGEKVIEFEKAWSEFIGCRDSIGLNSATAALHMALAAFKFPRGKKVLVPAVTFASTATAVHYNGLEPVFVDSDLSTVCMDLNDLERKIDHDCVAVIPVHFGGHPVEMEGLLEIAKLHKLKVIEDCAHTQGGEYKGRKLGTFGEIGCFSFEEKKGMTTGDGGMICSDDVELIAPIRAMKWVGIDKDTWKRSEAFTKTETDSRHWYYEIALLGYKYNMNNLCAAIGMAQLRKLIRFNENKRRAIGRYLEGVKGIPGIEPILPYDLTVNSSYWLFGLRLEKRDELIKYLKKFEIATGVHFTPLPLHPLWSGHKEPIPNALYLYDRIVTLPLFPDLSDEEVDYVVEKLRGFGG